MRLRVSCSKGGCSNLNSFPARETRYVCVATVSLRGPWRCTGCRVDRARRLDRAVWTAYGWPEDEDPATVDEDTILSRLLALNGERAG